MFGGIDRSALDDVEPSAFAWPKRNAAIPAFFKVEYSLYLMMYFFLFLMFQVDSGPIG